MISYALLPCCTAAYLSSSLVIYRSGEQLINVEEKKFSTVKFLIKINAVEGVFKR